MGFEEVRGRKIWCAGRRSGLKCGHSWVVAVPTAGSRSACAQAQLRRQIRWWELVFLPIAAISSAEEESGGGASGWRSRCEVRSGRAGGLNGLGERRDLDRSPKDLWGPVQVRSAGAGTG